MIAFAFMAVLAIGLIGLVGYLVISLGTSVEENKSTIENLLHAKWTVEDLEAALQRNADADEHARRTLMERIENLERRLPR